MKKSILSIPILTAALLGWAILLPNHAAERAVPGGWEQVAGKRVLYFTKSSGFEHSVVKRPGENQLSHSEQILTDLGRQHGFEVVCTKDGTIFTPEKLAGFDAIVFYTSGHILTPGTDKQPAMSAAGKEALLKAVRGGKGFVGVHAATDSFHSPGDRFISAGENVDPYIAMLGGEFIRHGPQQTATARVVDGAFPGCQSLQGQFEMMEEWYTYKDFAPDLHVILALETEGMKGIDYQRPPFPYVWARAEGDGRVFHIGLGHREDVWTNPIFQDLLLGGLGWAAGNVDADITPNLRRATPGAGEIQPKAESRN